jgi:hypothetical protein
MFSYLEHTSDRFNTQLTHLVCHQMQRSFYDKYTSGVDCWICVCATVSESALVVHAIELILMLMERDRVEKLSNRREDIERQGRFEFGTLVCTCAHLFFISAERG